MLFGSGVPDALFLFRFNGARAILSGPAGGVVGYALTTYNRETDSPVIGFDMGGKWFANIKQIKRIPLSDLTVL